MLRYLKYTLLTLTTLGILGACGAIGLFIWVSRDLPSITSVADYRLPQTSTVYARDGNIIGYFSREKRFLVNLDNMPKHVWQAFVAVEDRRFFSHPGVDLQSIARAFYTNFTTGRQAEGGSTITQQLIKRLLVGNERSYIRKAREAILAYQLENHLTKEQILYLYLNEIYLGNSSYGVEAASRTYFAKHVSELTVAEAAVLASLPQAPSENNPYSRPKNTKNRQLQVLKDMREIGYLTEEQYREAVAQPLEYKRMPDPSWSVGSWYLEEVRRRLLAFLSKENVERAGLNLTVYGEEALYAGGLHIHTAMDIFQQRASEIALRDGLIETDRRRGWRGPIKLQPAQYVDFLDQTPATLSDAGWAKALVFRVSKGGLDVLMGANIGRIDGKSMQWAHGALSSIKPGDFVWVSAVGAVGVRNPVSFPCVMRGGKEQPPAYHAEAVTPKTVLALALEQLPDLEGALASIEVTSGDLIAVAGGYNFSPESQFNRATQALRQPGSSFKPIVYSAALDNGLTAGTLLLDSPFTLPGGSGGKAWTPQNFDHKFLGPILLRTALALSRNACTVRVAQRVGMPAIVERAKALGIPGNIPEVLSVSLGSFEATPLTMAEAYTAFANDGKRITPRLITRIENTWREPIVTFEPAVTQAISPQNAYIMSFLLKEVVNAGTGARARILGRPVAGKTGTSNDARDAWFIGFSPYNVTSVYVGYDNNQPMGRGETGGRASLPIFIKFRQLIDPLYPPSDFKAPEGIVSATIDAATGNVSGGGGKAFTLPFMTGTVPAIGTGAFSAPETQGDSDADAMKDMFED